jgi:signal transduction histidine kinase
MQPTLAALSTTAEQTLGALAARNGFDAQHALDVGNSVLGGLPSRVARSRIEELITADRLKDEFLAVLCHELRNPLASIQNAIGILRSCADEDLAVRQRMHALIERQVSQMTLLAADLLDVSRITCGRLRLQLERVDLCVVVRDAIETLESEFNQRQQRVTVTRPDAPMWLRADAGRLEQVFINILGNASKYTDAGGELALSVSTREGHAVVCVRDSGIGIAHDMLPHIFDLFVQADETAPRSRSGLGIGLALVRMVAELHGGSVIAASAGIGMGSEFTVRLPQTS